MSLIEQMPEEELNELSDFFAWRSVTNADEKERNISTEIVADIEDEQESRESK